MTEKRETIVVEVDRREPGGSNASRRMRAAGRVPANVYGLDRPPFAVTVDPRKIEQVLHSPTGRNTIFTLSLEGGQQTRSVMLREIQRHPVTDALVHVDLLRFDPTKRIQVRVPVRLIGTPIGVRLESGILDFVHREVEVDCLPANIPEHLDVDVAELHVNQNVSVRNLTHDPDVRVLDAPDTILAVVTYAKEEVPAAEAAPAAAVAEPEIVGKEKEKEGPAGEDKVEKKGEKK
jgi:large subunit ribosomal protein L25